MAITIGQRLGSYEITALLGKGGMGEVYRARDNKLKRDVAIKILPDEFSRDADRVSRFQREAEVLASLNHPHIGGIYDLQQANGARFLVLELVEGETLAERIAHGPVPIDEARQIAEQLAEALEAAHERDIVHRDLKPANIKIKRDGTVKVLDFGLAKALEAQTPSATVSNSPTMFSGTIGGMIVGTAAYMSPEQARGQTVDARTDIWAFGCVVYEMLTRRRAFDGETVTDIIARVMEREPDWTLLPADTPPSTRTLLSATLTKDRRRRLQHIGDARLFLDPRDASESPAAQMRASRLSGWLAAGFALAFIGAAIPVSLYFLREPDEKTPIRFEMAVQGIESQFLNVVVSPDGQHVAYVATVDGKTAVWVRPTGAVKGAPLAGTENAAPVIFWSPDSRFIAFFKDTKLEKVSVTGGNPTALAEATFAAPGAWSRDGAILFSKSMGTAGGIARVSELGGEVTPVIQPDRTHSAFVPRFLPDGRHFLYLFGPSLPSRQEQILYASALGSKETKRVMTVGPDDVLPVYASGYLLFGRNQTVMAQKFDANTLQLAGEAVPLLEQMSGPLSVSDNGVLVYRATPRGAVQGPVNRLAWLDRSGNEIGQAGVPGPYRDLRLSPDGNRVVVGTLDTNGDIWVLDLNPSKATRITFDPAVDIGPVWSGDGTHVGFASDRGDNRKLYQHSATGAGTDEVIYAGEVSERSTPTDWSRDGRYMIFSHSSSGSQLNVWILPRFGDQKPYPFLPDAPFRRNEGRLSSDGHWLAYTTNEFGRNEIIVQSFPDPNGGKWQVSVNGGIDPLWRPDGRELYYLNVEGKLMAVPIQGGSALGNGPPVTLFQTALTVQGVPSGTRFDATPDGRRFLMIVPAADANTSSAAGSDAVPITAIVNWTALLRKK